MEAGFHVKREKIETVPFHPSAPSRKNNITMPQDCYFETHFNIICDDNRMASLKDISLQVDGHLSRNIFKKIDDNLYTIMLTCRSYTETREDFDERVKSTAKTLHESGFEVAKTIVEFSLYDTLVSHDKAWLTS